MTDTRFLAESWLVESWCYDESEIYWWSSGPQFSVSGVSMEGLQLQYIPHTLLETCFSSLSSTVQYLIEIPTTYLDMWGTTSRKDFPVKNHFLKFSAKEARNRTSP